MTGATEQQVIVCLASFFKGTEFIRACKSAGARVLLVTREKFLNEGWPHKSIEEIIAVPNDASADVYIYAASQLGRTRKITHVVALEEYDVITAALIREHLCLEGGMTATTARTFRDKLAMRTKAHAAGIRVPEFVHLLNYNDVGHYMERVPPPWVAKPRSDVSAIGIKKLADSEQVWRAIDAFDVREKMQERAPYYLLERFVPGEVYHVDSLVSNSKVIFAGVNRYGRPPMNVAHEGGVFISYTIEHDAPEQRQLLKINQELIKALGLERGATHAEFIQGREDGEFYFLEIAARVGGANIAEVLEAASGINLWREWARLELTSHTEKSYELPPVRKDYGGIALSLARQEYPDTSSYIDAEITYRVKKRYHVGLVVGAPDLKRVRELLEDYAARFANDFAAVLPPLERPE